MNKAQTAKIQRITSWTNKLADRDGGLHFSAETSSDGHVLLFGSNTYCSDKAWFYVRFFFYVGIGPRGGVSIYTTEGFTKQQILAA
jgi:hypothetical protein